MAPSLSEIADEFGFGDEERDRKLGGDISLAFFLLGAPASIVIGCLADSSNRSVLFAWTVFIGEGACLATYWVNTYRWLYVCRAVTGFSVGGAVPLIYSVLGDLFAAKDRHLISALVSFGTGAGIAVGQAIAGFLGPIYGWRLPFLVVAVPALITATMVLFTVPDPPRGAMECVDDNTTEEDGVALVSMTPKLNDGDDASRRSPRQSNKVSYTPLNSPPRDDRTASTVQEESSSAPFSDIGGEDCYDVVPDAYPTSLHCLSMSMHLKTMSSLLSTPTVVLAIIQGAPGCITWYVNSLIFTKHALWENKVRQVVMTNRTYLLLHEQGRNQRVSE